MHVCEHVCAYVHECVKAGVLERSSDHWEKGFLLLFQNQNGGVRRQNHQSVFFCVFFPLQSGKQKDNVIDWLLPIQQKAQILKLQEQKIVWHISPPSSVIKLPLKYTHKKPFAKLLSPPSKSHILSCH